MSGDAHQKPSTFWRTPTGQTVDVTDIVTRAIAQEREACARVCEQYSGDAAQEWLAQLLADRIRARSQ